MTIDYCDITKSLFESSFAGFGLGHPKIVSIVQVRALFVPAFSAPAERVFSHSGIFVRPNYVQAVR